jgi:hypothetical protein
LSGGLSANFTEKKAIMLATRSIVEWIASEIIETEPLNNPTTNFKTIKSEFE